MCIAFFCLPYRIAILKNSPTKDLIHNSFAEHKTSYPQYSRVNTEFFFRPAVNHNGRALIILVLQFVFLIYIYFLTPAIKLFLIACRRLTLSLPRSGSFFFMFAIKRCRLIIFLDYTIIRNMSFKSPERLSACTVALSTCNTAAI